ncbi:hypothetical protein MBLNU457_6370t2 [Dothideomycetes sp. NU457]
MSSPTSTRSSASARGFSSTWQTRLASECSSRGFQPPCYEMFSDRRDALMRTARDKLNNMHQPPHIVASTPKPEHATQGPQQPAANDSTGGRTAWSSTVSINGQGYSARYWYAGDHANNAREDAAEVALQRMGIIPTPRSPYAQHK